jgi:hypothetical protein
MIDKILLIAEITVKVITFVIVEVVPFGRAIQNALKKKK